VDQERQTDGEDDPSRPAGRHRFRSNEALLWLSVIACNLGNLWRRLGLPQRIKNWWLTSLQRAS